jgi:hypothetical protein
MHAVIFKDEFLHGSLLRPKNTASIRRLDFLDALRLALRDGMQSRHSVCLWSTEKRCLPLTPYPTAFLRLGEKEKTKGTPAGVPHSFLSVPSFYFQNSRFKSYFVTWPSGSL